MIRLACIVEIPNVTNEYDAQKALDAFRETVQPEMNYGIVIYRAPEPQAKGWALYTSTPRYGCNEIAMYRTEAEAYGALASYMQIGHEGDPAFADDAIPAELEDLIEWCQARRDADGSDYHCQEVDLPKAADAGQQGDLTEDERGMVCEAIDSHTYWQLSDEHYRNDGYVTEPGSDDEDKAADIKKFNALQLKLRAPVTGGG